MPFFNQSEKMSGKIVYKSRINDGDFSHKFLHQSKGKGGSQDKKRSLCDRGQQEETQTMVERRILRCQYRNLKISIAEEKEEIANVDSNKFDSVFSKVQNLHDQVCRPREQVADAEALNDITSALLASVKSTQNSNGISIPDFISALLRSYGDKANGNTALQGNNNQTYISWEKLGLDASTIFSPAAGASTLLGPMDNEAKPRRVVRMRRHQKPTESTRPEKVADSISEENKETDKNMVTMFNILRKHKQVRLEALVLNRRSFSQTVENIFALSFLVKDGRAEIKLDENKNHIIVPKNAPTATDMSSGEASYSQFIFRFDFKDWELMMESTDSGQDLMPHRNSLPLNQKSDNAAETQIRKISRNRGRETPVTLSARGLNECSSQSSGEKKFSKSISARCPNEWRWGREAPRSPTARGKRSKWVAAGL
ncbi:non-structural maintenance of chromosomes element 4 homolog A isoform X1 [Cryptomeria japonica]|uniref:non-structural maintenance of chromosomes element 4 homolog A isoform X1 n=2 Tax=Cryptomeria japonica TaxID=3369 RepID=UPI0027DA3E03|nr:non-structural maintenance of chromosomes element 4 homolog A isoform X1 [Cryptomeria japonica]